MTIQKLVNRFRNFAKDQGGMEALQTVCIVAIAATLLIAAATAATRGNKVMTDNYNKLHQQVSEAGKAESTPFGPATPDVDQLE